MPVTPVAPSPTMGPAPAPRPAAKTAETAEKFEAVFLGQMTQMMMESVDTGGEFSGGHGEAMFRGVLAEKLGTAMARKGGLGLAPAVLAQMIKMQGDSGHGQ